MALPNIWKQFFNKSPETVYDVIRPFHISAKLIGFHWFSLQKNGATVHLVDYVPSLIVISWIIFNLYTQRFILTDPPATSVLASYFKMMIAIMVPTQMIFILLTNATSCSCIMEMLSSLNEVDILLRDVGAQLTLSKEIRYIRNSVLGWMSAIVTQIAVTITIYYFTNFGFQVPLPVRVVASAYLLSAISTIIVNLQYNLFCVFVINRMKFLRLMLR